MELYGRHRHTTLALALLLWGGFLAGCATFGGSSEERSTSDTLAVASDSLDSLRADSSNVDTRLAAAQDSLATDSLAPDSLATDSLADASSADDTTLTERPVLSNDSLRQLTPRDTIPSGESSTTGDQRVRVRADSLSERRDENNQRLQELLGNVRVEQDSTRLRSIEAVRYLDSDEFLFTGDVVIYERGDTLRSTRVRYDRSSKVGRAFGAVHLSDGDVDVYSTRAVYYSEEKRSVFPDSVLLVDDGRTLTAASGVYYSDDQQAEFFGDVHVRDPDTYMEADSVRYFRNQDRTEARGNVFIDRNPRVARGLDRLLRFNERLISDPEEQLDLDSARAALDRTTPGRTTPGRTTQTLGDSVAVDSATADTSLADTSLADTALADTAIASTTDVDTTDVDTAAARDGSGEQMLLWGDRAENDEEQKTSRVTGRALLLQVRADSAGNPSDTLLVRSRRLDASRSDTLDRMIAMDSVRIWQPDLAATADSVVYDRFYVTDTEPSTTSESAADSSTSDSSRVDSFASDSLRAVPHADDTTSGGGDGRSESTDTDRRASVREEDVPGHEETRLFQSPLAWFDGSQVKGDTIRVLVRNRSVDTVFVRSNAFAAQYDSVSTNVQQLTGAEITAVFRRESIQSIVARPNARAIRFLTGSDGSPNGAAKTSSDRIVLRFEDGEVERVSVLGGTETTYYKQAIVPDPFQLEGYVWTPDAKPTKSDFLQEPRVRNRLNVPPPLDSVDSTLVQAPQDSASAPSEDTTRSSEKRTGSPDGVEPERGAEASNSDLSGDHGASAGRREQMPARRDSSASSPPP